MSFGVYPLPFSLNEGGGGGGRGGAACVSAEMDTTLTQVRAGGGLGLRPSYSFPAATLFALYLYLWPGK